MQVKGRGGVGHEYSYLCPCFSSEEQAREGISIEAQLAALREWARRERHTVAGEYIDAGISARKNPAKRPALQKLLVDLERREIKLIAFTKLDRWTRNVKGYYAVQDVLDRYGVAWTAIHEDYETLTSNGRFTVNLMLSIAENEADRTSERIKRIFEYKIARGEAISKRGLPVGYSIKDKKVVPDERAPAIRAAFEHYAQHGSVVETRDFVRGEYGLDIGYNSMANILQNRLYLGEYRDNLQYCEPIIDAAIFDRVQRGLKSRSFRKNPSGRVYIFSGLLFCPVCGRHFTGCYAGRNRQNYRCNNAVMEKRCTNHRSISERVIEGYLLEHVGAALDGMEAQAEAQRKEAARRKAPDAAAINAKLSRLNDLYVDGVIDKEKFVADRKKLLEQLHAAQNATAPPDFAPLRQIVGADFARRYGALSAQGKRELWRALISRIEIPPTGDIRFYFAV